MTHTIHFEQLPETFDALLKGMVKGRVVVNCNDLHLKPARPAFNMNSSQN